ncbi:MAG: hypothetical protein KJ914_12520 [Gammaproteobacteria bacterium]|nr:hypothetical protein [Gammaproteobacteria bacterium]MBU1725342.1 hypothetical protein [Gammaproteobacteria bacterium]MBU2004351.1 hypothetical protein [Gammaproteobacteria bacterium]
MMQPNTEKRTVLPVSGGIQGVSGTPEVGDGGKTSQPFGVFKKMSARSGWDEQIWVFLQPRYLNFLRFWS